jgi:hypothetical protein
VLGGERADQSALHGVLAKVRDPGMHLVSVRQLDADDDAEGQPPS